MVRSPSGHLRVAVPLELGLFSFASLLAGFSRLHSRITTEIISTQYYPDIVGEALDVSTQIGPLQDSSYFWHLIGDFPRELYASSAR